METSTTLSSSHFTESLNNYLHSNKKPEQFFLGHWLITLTDEELAYLCDQNSDIYDKDRETDALGVVVLALLAETKKMEFSVEYLFAANSRLHETSSLESCRRLGWVELNSILSIQPDIQEIDRKSVV